MPLEEGHARGHAVVGETSRQLWKIQLLLDKSPTDGDPFVDLCRLSPRFLPLPWLSLLDCSPKGKERTKEQVVVKTC